MITQKSILGKQKIFLSEPNNYFQQDLALKIIFIDRAG